MSTHFPSTCIFISTFRQRKSLIDEFIKFYQDSEICEVPLFIFSDEKQRINQPSNIVHIADEFHSISAHLGHTPKWGERLTRALSYLVNNYERAIFMPDDAFIQSVDIYRFKHIFNNFLRFNSDFYSLTHDFKVKQPMDYEGLKFFKRSRDFLEMEYSYLPWYLTHQPSLWKLETLKRITYPDDTAVIHETQGFFRAQLHKIKLNSFESKCVFDAKGRFKEGVGINKKGLCSKSPIDLPKNLSS
tara:strand:+ start:5050 stop:5781 length:732 start_codon:yes stop_codon:yes gene_type:complete